MKTTHILKTSVGVTCELTLDETAATFVCQWSPPPPFPPTDRAQVIAEYLPWRNDIIERWSKRTGKRVAVITI